MSTREDLNEAKRALALIANGEDYKIALCFGFHRDPASGRQEWTSVTLPFEDTALILEKLHNHVKHLSIQLANELREEADRLDSRGK